jgi:AcrR family transcriptional regulator
MLIMKHADLHENRFSLHEVRHIMKAAVPPGRVNQKLRTRAALVSAALSLLRAGKSPTISEVAEAALVSPATAYRYFPNSQSLWLAVLAESGEPDKAGAFAGTEQAGAAARVETMIRAAGFRMFDDEMLWRTASRALHAESGGEARGAQRIPVPTGQRMRWIREALRPCERELGRRMHRRLTMALSLVIGSETITTLRDICGLEVEEAKAVSLWVGQALARAALAEAQSVGAGPTRRRQPGRKKPGRARRR